MGNKSEIIKIIKNINRLFENREVVIQQFKDLVYELFEKDQWPKADEMAIYFNLPPSPFSSIDRAKYGMEEEFKLLLERRVMCETFSFAIPSLEALQLIAKFQPILEIGAGSGFWATLLKRHNCDVITTDIKKSFPKEFTEIEYLSAIDAIEKYPDRNVFCSWPDLDTWAEEVLPYIKNKLIYIGEWNGCTASDNFHDILAKEFKIIAKCTIPQWYLINDNLTVLERV